MVSTDVTRYGWKEGTLLPTRTATRKDAEMDWALSWPWLALALLGAYHGLNPGMGWLFAVVLGLQERRRAAVLRALPVIAVGHEASIAVVAVLVALAQEVAAAESLRSLGALVLVLFG